MSIRAGAWALLVVLLVSVSVSGVAGGAVSAASTPTSSCGVSCFGQGNPAWDGYYAAPSDTGTWAGFCAGAGGSVVAQADGVPACGPTGGTNVEIPGGGWTPGFQCVELSERFLYISRGWTSLHANGAQVAGVYSAGHGAPLVHNGTAGVAPHVGDVMSFSTTPNYSDTGHTGVVTASNIDGSGNGAISLLSENISGTGNLQTFSVHSWTVASAFGFAYSEWVQSGVASSVTHAAVGLIPGRGGSGYVVDGYGGLHPINGAPVATPSATYPGWDIIRGIAVTGAGSGYTIDGWGGLHPFGTPPPLADSSYWKNWDIVRGIALCPGGRGGYVLDGFGGVHAVGTAPPEPGTAYWPNWDIARAITVNSTCNGGYVLDGYGGVHPFGASPGVHQTGSWPGWDIARGITLVTDTSGYVLDGYGGLAPFYATGTPEPSTTFSGAGYSGGHDLFRGVAFDPVGRLGVQATGFPTASGSTDTTYTFVVTTIHAAVGLIPGRGVSGYVVDGYGGLHPINGAPVATPSATYPGWDIIRGIAVTGAGSGYTIDGWGGLHPFGTPPPLADNSYWKNWDIVRGIALCPGGRGGYVLDGFGGVHAVGTA